MRWKARSTQIWEAFQPIKEICQWQLQKTSSPFLCNLKRSFMITFEGGSRTNFRTIRRERWCLDALSPNSRNQGQVDCLQNRPIVMWIWRPLGLDMKTREMDGCQHFHHSSLHFIQERTDSGGIDSSLSAVTQSFAPASSNQSSHTMCTCQLDQLSHVNKILFYLRFHQFAVTTMVHFSTFEFPDDGSSLTLIEKEVLEQSWHERCWNSYTTRETHMNKL